MKNYIIKAVSLFTVAAIIFALCACSRKKTDGSKLITNRSVTISTMSSQQTVTEEDPLVIAVAPEGQQEILEYLNGSLTKFHNYSFDFNKNVTTVCESFSAGDLDDVEGATDAYRSTLKSACTDMMGVSSLDTSYYVGDDIKDAFPFTSVKEEVVQSASAEADGSKVIVSITLRQQSEDGTATAQLLTNDYFTVSAFNEKIKEYEASATNTTVKIYNVTLRAVIDYSTRNFDSVVVSFNTDFSADNLSLAYVKGGPVTGKTLTTVTYKDFSEK